MDAYERIQWINETEGIDRKLGMVDMLNEMMGTDFRLLDGRVVYSSACSAHTAAFYANCYDLESTLAVSHIRGRRERATACDTEFGVTL